MELTNDERYEARFERIESVLEVLANGQKQLLTSQVLMADGITKVASQQVNLMEAQVALTEAQAELTEAQKKTELSLQETQEKLDALIHMWDDWIRERRRREGEGPAIQ